LAICSSRRFHSAAAASCPGDSMRFFAWLIRDSAARGCTNPSSMCSSFSASFTTES
jgi:hypothetical protein